MGGMTSHCQYGTALLAAGRPNCKIRMASWPAASNWLASLSES
jgi:hypothetical protein